MKIVLMLLGSLLAMQSFASELKTTSRKPFSVTSTIWENREIPEGRITHAECPSSEKEFDEKTPVFLIQTVAQRSKGQISDFSAKVGKGGAVAGVVSMKAGTENWYFVRADFRNESISGVVKCDAQKNQLVVVSMGWHSSIGSAVVGLLLRRVLNIQNTCK